MKRTKMISYLLSLSMMVTSIPMQTFAYQVETQDNETHVDLEQQVTTQSAIKMAPSQEYSGDGFDVKFEVTDQWNDAFNANMIISNTSDESLENWTLTFNFDHEITNIWGAQIISHEGNTYIIKNVTYNQNIPTKDSVTIGFTGARI